MDLRPVFARNLRALRNARDMSQEQLADEVGMSRGYLSQLETGKWHVSLAIIGKLADALKVDPAEFLRAPASRRARKDV